MSDIEVSAIPANGGVAAAVALDDLARAFRHAGLGVTETATTMGHGDKDFGLTAALAVAGITIDSIGLLISAMSFWRDRNPSFGASISSGELVLSVEGLTEKELTSAVAALREAAASSPAQGIVVVIHERPAGSA